MAGLPAGGDPAGFDVTSPDAVLARVVREHAGRLAASLVSLLGDFSAAEDLVADAVETALRRWPVEGVPERPDAWLFTVAKNRGLDVLRRQARYREKLAQLQWPVQPEPDDRLRLIFTCCHPAKTDWPQIVILYDMLLRLAPSPVTWLHRAIALRYVAGAEKALAELDSLDLDRYHLYHATRAELLRDLGRSDEAREADQRALELTANPAEQALLEQPAQALTAATRSTMPSLSRSRRCTTNPACSTNGSGRRVW